MRNISLLIALCLLTAGCAPILMSGGPRSISYDNVTRANLNESQRMAEAHCQKYNRHAVPIEYGDFNVTYECKE